MTNTARLNRFALLGLALALAVGLAVFGMVIRKTSAVISGTPCSGNVCTGSVTVGGQAVQYAYTQHVAPGGQFRIRFNGGVYNTGSMVSFILSGMPTFGAEGYMENPTNGAQAMVESDVNPGRTAYERSDSDGCASCIYDHVMSVQYAALAAGTYTFNLTVLQNGSSGGANNLTFFVDAGAPTNVNESTPWLGIPDMDESCADGVDNDLDFRGDCADVQCAGSVGDVLSGALCEAVETTCNDEFDNDANGRADCLDSACDGLVGEPFGTALCQFNDEYGVATCGDNFDNDGDGRMDCVDNTATDSMANHACWKQMAYGCPAVETSCTDNVDNDKDQSYASAWDNAPLTGVDCQDYDCAGNAACPASEDMTAGGVAADAQCFDGLDNDLDTDTDCADIDCANTVNPGNPSQACLSQEFDLAAGFQYCANSFDDDGSGLADCSDASCHRAFGNCGPCPSREDITWNSCADGGDTDADFSGDCADAECTGDVGSTDLGAICSLAENSDDLCSDGFDNDLDGLADCMDAQCSGQMGPDGAVCQPSGETSCSDGADNDNDGFADCLDSECAGVGLCSAAAWSQVASCQTVPRFSGVTFFTSDDPTISTVVRIAARVNDVDTVRLMGSDTYASVTVVVGDNADPAGYYPYAAAGPDCTLTDTASGIAASRFSFTAVAGHAVQVFNTSGPDISGFDITLTCATPGTPAALRNYPVSLSALKSGNVPEYGDLAFSTTLYEDVLPIMTGIEGEGASGGVMTVPYGGVSSPVSRRFRGLPQDPAPDSGICRCDIEVDGAAYGTTSNCISPPFAFLSDVASLEVRGRAEDGAANVGAYGALSMFSVNVTPALDGLLTLLPTSPFFKDGMMAIGRLTADFYTGGSDTFMPSCDVYLYNDSGSLINGPIGPSFSFPGIPVGNALRCDALNIDLPSGLSDGRYFLKIRATDNEGNFTDSNLQTLYVCNTVPGPTDPEPTNGCQYADFDRDGASEGLYTTLYSAAPIACDNCINLSNPSQLDNNANGVGDMCEPPDVYGRCEIDTDIVCLYDSDEAPFCPGDALCCPGPSIKDDPLTGAPKDPQACEMSWGLCTISGEVCFSDPQCPGGQGLCQDGATACYHDDQCGALPGTALCTGADACDDSLTPWLQTSFGNVFSGNKITVAEPPPQDLYNATYCVTAKGVISNFLTEGLGGCAAQTDPSARPTLPKESNRYTSVLGKIDLVGLRAGKFGTVVTVPAAQLDATLTSYANRLGGRVIRVVGDATVSARMIANDTDRGAGTILIDGGNLTIAGDITYESSSVTALKQLASLGWMVLDDGSGTKGNVYVDKDVTSLAGAFYLDGNDGFSTVAPPEVASNVQLTVYGLVVGRDFHLGRSYEDETQGAERFIYDGRAVVNPPPGFADVTKSLPTLSPTVP